MVLKLANKKKKKVLVASTSEVYGKSDDVPFHEDADLVMGADHKGRWSYACSKAIDEFLALAYCKEKKLPWCLRGSSTPWARARPALRHGRSPTS
jgi:UDP-glucose 4-epimerase